MVDVSNMQIEKVDGFIYNSQLYRSKTELLKAVKERLLFDFFLDATGWQMCKEMSELTGDELEDFMSIITLTEDELGGIIK